MAVLAIEENWPQVNFISWIKLPEGKTNALIFMIKFIVKDGWEIQHHVVLRKINYL